jgi:hypothetical protein
MTYDSFMIPIAYFGFKSKIFTYPIKPSSQILRCDSLIQIDIVTILQREPFAYLHSQITAGKAIDRLALNIMGTVTGDPVLIADLQP